MKSKLKWKQKKCQDLSASWYQAEVKQLNWTYIIDSGLTEKTYMCFVAVSFLGEENCLAKKNFKTLGSAKKFCEDHLCSVYKSIKKIFE